MTHSIAKAITKTSKKNNTKKVHTSKKLTKPKKLTNMVSYFNKNKINVSVLSHNELKLHSKNAKNNILKLFPKASFYYDITTKSTPKYLAWWLVKHFPGDYAK